jgi:hypothetical protein
MAPLKNDDESPASKYDPTYKKAKKAEKGKKKVFTYFSLLFLDYILGNMHTCTI